MKSKPKTGSKTLTKDYLDSSIKELRFSLLQILHLKSTLEEIEVMTKDPLVIAVIKNSLERHQVDKLIHARNIFNK